MQSQELSQPLLEVAGLKKYFPITAGLLRRQVGAVRAVDGIDFSIAPKEAVGLVGESGSGKSTAGRCAIGLLKPTEGDVRFRGRELFQLTGEEQLQARKGMQMVFQNPYGSLNPRRTVGEAIGEVLYFHKLVSDAASCQRRMRQLLDQVGLSAQVVDRYPHAFSGGQQQRLCIARALAVEPKLLVCDEAVSALDVSVQAQILNLLLELKEELGLSYLFISHDLATVRLVCDRLLVLYLGQVMEEGPVEAVIRAPRHPYTQALLRAVPRDHPNQPKQQVLLQGEQPSAAEWLTGCPFRSRCPYAQQLCRGEIGWKEVGGGHRYRCLL